MWMTVAYMILEIIFILTLFSKRNLIVKSISLILALVIALIIYIRFNTGHNIPDLPCFNFDFVKGLSGLEITVWLGSALLLTIVVYIQIIKFRDRDW
jgi:hypothetical protein